LQLPEAKTKVMLGVLKKLGLSGRTLVVVKELTHELEMASRNIPDITLLTTRGLNVYDLISHSSVLMTKEVVSEIQEVWS
jgi:large subunit ribosomal protein L4